MSDSDRGALRRTILIRCANAKLISGLIPSVIKRSVRKRRKDKIFYDSSIGASVTACSGEYWPVCLAIAGQDSAAKVKYRRPLTANSTLLTHSSQPVRRRRKPNRKRSGRRMRSGLHFRRCMEPLRFSDLRSLKLAIGGRNYGVFLRPVAKHFWCSLVPWLRDDCTVQQRRIAGSVVAQVLP